jgi:cytochrome c-type biogenesis protein CcmH/NrfG
MAASQAGLLADHNFTSQAEQAYQAATEICPSNPDAVFGYVKLLVGQDRVQEAIPVVEAAVKNVSENAQFKVLLEQLRAKEAE